MICWIQKLPSMPKCHFFLSTLFSRDPCISAHSPQPDPHACYFHRSHLFELPITLHLARRLGAFEFVQPTIQRLGSLHPALLDLDFGIILHTDFQKGAVALPNPHATRLFLLIYTAFPQLHRSNHLGGDSRDSWGYTEFHPCCPTAAQGPYLLNISQLCVSF